MCIHDNSAGLGLPENPGQTNHRKYFTVDHIAEHISCTNRWKLINISHQNQTHVRRDCFHQRIHQNNINHRTLIHNQNITLKRCFLIFLIAFRRFEFQKSVDSLCLQTGGFRHSLGSTSCRSRQQYIQSKGTISCNDSLGCGGFSCTRTTGKNQNLCSRCSADGFHLHLIIFHIYSILNLIHIHRQLRITGILSGFHKRNP